MQDLLLGPAEIKSLSAILRRIRFFSDLSSPDLERIFDVTKLRGYAGRHTTIFRKGQPGDALYMIHKGEVDIVLPRLLLPNRKLARLKAGEFFGEMALLRQARRTATAIANGPAELFVLSQTDFNDIVRKNPTFARELERMAARRAFETEISG